MSSLTLGCAMLALAPLAGALQCDVTELDVTSTQLFPDASQIGEALDASGARFVTSSFREFIFPISSGDGTRGAAYVHEHRLSGWELDARIFVPGLTGVNAFGFAVALDGDTLAVSAPSFCAVDFVSGACPPGRVALFERGDTSWEFVEMLMPSDSSVDDIFGVSLALDGDTLAVGALFGTTTTAPGAVYIFERSGGTWTETAKLESDSGQADALFGKSVALDGDVLAVAAPGDEIAGTLDGSVTIFERDAGLWTRAGTFAIPLWLQGEFGNYRSGALAVSGDTVVVGSPRASQIDSFPTSVPQAVQNGAVVVLERNSSTWSESATLRSGEPVGDDLFGAAVDIDGDHILVGASRTDGGMDGSGVAYLYERSALGWVPRGTWQRDQAAATTFDRLGFAVALAEDDILIGAPSAGTAPFLGNGIVAAASRHDAPCAGEALLGAPGLISLTDGGEHVLGLDVGPTHAGDTYVVLGSITGTSPGIPLAGGSVTLPLNADAWFTASVSLANTSPFAFTLGTLDDAGRATARIEIPAGIGAPSLEGLSLWHAALVRDATTNTFTTATNAVRLVMVP